MTGWVDRQCAECGYAFKVKEAQVRRGRGVCCSRECSGKHTAAMRGDGHKGAGNPNWKGGVSQGSKVRYTKPFKDANPEKVQAHHAVRAAIRAGRLVRPGACSQCQKVCKPQAHHDDYGKPLEVRWLCVGCHVRLHHLGRKKAA